MDMSAIAQEDVRRSLITHAGARIRDCQIEPCSVDFRDDLDAAASWFSLNPMPDGVFNEWLQEEGQYGRIQCRPIDTSLDHKLVMKPQGLHFEVGIDNVHLLPERNEWPLMLVESGPQEHA